MSATETARFCIPTGCGSVAFEAIIAAKDYDGIALLETFLRHHGNAAERAAGVEGMRVGQGSVEPKSAPSGNDERQRAGHRAAPRVVTVKKHTQLELPRLEIALYGIGRRSAKRRRTA
jgi:hypothetical protein